MQLLRSPFVFMWLYKSYNYEVMLSLPKLNLWWWNCLSELGFSKSLQLFCIKRDYISSLEGFFYSIQCEISLLITSFAVLVWLFFRIEKIKKERLKIWSWYTVVTEISVPSTNYWELIKGLDFWCGSLTFYWGYEFVSMLSCRCKKLERTKLFFIIVMSWNLII